MNTFQAKKIGMTQLFDSEKRLVPVCMVEVLASLQDLELKEGQRLSVQGVSKGKGFQGVVKRYNARGDKASHGRKHSARRVGSIGSGFPEHVFKGKKMPGRMGSSRLTIKGLRIVAIDQERNLLAISGALPGAPGSMLRVTLNSPLT